MKEIFFATLFVLGASAAHAGEIRLNFINTNDCARAQSEVMLLNSPQTHVTAVCQGPGYFPSDNGMVYAFRLFTTVEVPGPLSPGMVFRLNDIDTNDCTWAQSEIQLLNSARIRVEAECSPYTYHGYPSNNGQWYDYRLFTTLVLQ